jgi:mRNA-degrading endonuclease RelE of RelBE toxin-antitoxin system
VPRLVLTRRAQEQIADLPDGVRDAVDLSLDRLAVDPDFGKALLGRLEGTRSARVGNYRILYTLEGTPASLTVVVRSVRHRAIAYRRRRRR